MTEHETNLQKTQELIDHVSAASEFGNATLGSAVLNTSESGIVKNAQGVVTATDIHVTKNGTDGNPEHLGVRYRDVGISDDGVEPSGERHVRTSIDVGRTRYKAELSTEADDKIRNAANLEREGYGVHHFTRKNRQQAASLITHLAVKSVARDATHVVETYDELRETYLKKTKS
ncbi:MAG: hypothetical protein WC498_03455 [Candidatus Saccharimonadales bacterium]